jgi:hypothetical protein
MSREEELKNPALFDNRVIDRHIKKGLTTRKDFEKHLKALPDVRDKICPPEERSGELTGVGPDRDDALEGDSN